jgi:hypothetical protein
MPAADPLATYHVSGNSPARHAAAITPHDTNELTAVTRGIYVGGAGNVAVITIGGETVVFIAPPVGTVIPVQAKIVKSTSTTATSLIALW